MQNVCTNMLKEGVIWDAVHLTAHEIGKALFLSYESQGSWSRFKSLRGVLVLVS
jgi:hypothetical protein